MADVVVDASIAVKWVIEEEGSDAARTLLRSWLTAGIQPIAPSWLTCEVANILYRKAMNGDVTFADALAAYDDLLPFVTTPPNTPRLENAAWASPERSRSNNPTTPNISPSPSGSVLNTGRMTGDSLHRCQSCFRK